MGERLGKYTLERRIAAGGMAEVFLARSDDGRSCVIKRMLPNLLVDPQFSRMFLDEAKLVVQLNHPAIAQVYDFGQDKGVLYLAMEWVDGTNLRTIVKDFAKRKERIPVEHCARLVAQAALALGYAHRAAGLDGKPLKIIHRDVSPQNILLGSTGVVKLIDFGVAKASSSTMVTAAGMIKGKFAYMSPEQLRGDPLDGRSDIYGLGLVLYELLAAERAIPGASEAEIAQNALTMKFPPIEVKRPDTPPALRAILTRALQRDRNHRYDTCEQLAAELETFIIPRKPNLSGADLATILPDLETPATPAAVMAAPLPRSDSNSKLPLKPQAFWDSMPPTAQMVRAGGLQEGNPTRPVTQDAAPTQQAHDLPINTFTPALKTVINPPGLMPKAVANAPPGRRIAPEALQSYGTSPKLKSPPRRLSWFLGAMLVGLIAASIAWRVIEARTAAPTPLPAPAPAVVQAPVKPPEPAPAPPAPVVAPVVAEPAPVADARPKVTFTSTIAARVSVDGKVLGKAPIDATLEPGAHQVLFEEAGGDTRQTRKLELKPGETRTEEWKPERGRVLVRAVPWAEVFLGGKSLGVTPLEPIPMLSGRHTLSFVNTDTGRKDEKVVEVKPNAEVMVKVDLRSGQ